MVRIWENGRKITYTKGDTFLLSIFPEDGECFTDGSTLEFIIADEASKDALLDNTYSLSDGGFDIEFSKKDKETEYGKYVYKMILKMIDGTVVTQKDGEFEVIWGA